MAEAVAPLRIPHFRALWLASIFSNVGSFLQSAAAALLVFQLTGSATWVGLMSASTTLPYLGLALFAGAVADMTERAKVLLVSQSVMGLAAAAMAGLTVAGMATPERLVGLGLVMGVAGAFNLPAWQALVPELVPREMVASAVALNSVAFNVARTVGPVLGGILVATVGAGAGFGLNAISFLLVILVVAVIRGRLEEGQRERSSISSAIGLGLRFARYTRPFRWVLALVAMFALTSAVVQTILPNHNAALGGDELSYGLILGAMGVGAIIAGLTRRNVVESLGRKARPVTIIGFGVFGIGVGLAPSLLVAGMFMFLSGMCWVWTLTGLNATTQLMAPDWVRGRAMSLYTLSFVGIYPLGSILAGALADSLGTRSAYVGLSSAVVLLGFFAGRMPIPTLAEVEAPEFTSEQINPHIDTAEGGPVMVLNTWAVDQADTERFLEVMNRVRLVRLRTGAYRWRLYRNASDPQRLTEIFLTVSWEEHLNQHRRIDNASRRLIEEARGFDRDGGPITRHLVAVDVESPPNWNDLLITHEELHSRDGSIPLVAKQEPDHGAP
jgi:MFS family permease